MDDVVVLEWTFSPPDCFEALVRVEREGYVMIIDNGKVEARIQARAYDGEHNMRDELHAALNNRFLGAQLLICKTYNLSKSSMYRLHSDGRKDITLFPDSLVSTTSFGTVDILAKDREGNITCDSRGDRIAKKKALAELAETYGAHDKFAQSILTSFRAAITDPKDELVHLYEIREALSSRFGGKEAARSALAISYADWSRIGRLANSDPIQQGRHRGENVGKLRDATEAELQEARNIARNMVEAYLEYLERSEYAINRRSNSRS